MSAESPLRQLFCRSRHQPVTRHLRDDRGCGNGSTEAVPADYSALLIIERGHLETINQTDAPGPSDANQRLSQRCKICFVQPALVNSTSAARNNDDASGGLHHNRQQRLTRRVIMLLRVI